METIHLLSNWADFLANEILSPVLFWTLLAGVLLHILDKSEAFSPSFQFECRLALISMLPATITDSLLYEWMSGLLAESQSFSLIQLSLPAIVASPQSNPQEPAMFSDPYFWIGFLAILSTLGMVFMLVQFIGQLISLKRLQNKLTFKPLTELDFLSAHHNYENINHSVQIAYSKLIDIPFTYGHQRPTIVLPEDLRNRPEEQALAIKHELMHIQHHDFLMHAIALLIQAVFWFHPLIHPLVRGIGEYREIVRDKELLADDHSFSRKSYATLLFKFAAKKSEQPLVMQMAVPPSTLKKRIRIMATQTQTKTTYRIGSLIIFSTALLIVGMVSCTDITSDGLTTSEFTQAQQQMEQKSKFSVKTDSDPIFYINDKKYTSDGESNIIARLKPKYIKSIRVYKDQEAIEQFGQEGKNGVVVLRLHEGVEQVALEDLKTPEEMTQALQKTEENVYVVTEEMPKLIGGLASVQDEIIYPEEAKANGIEGQVIVQFIVDEQGNVTEPHVIRGIGSGCDKAALEAVKTAKFEPGKQRGKPVKVQFTLPITFKL